VDERLRRIARRVAIEQETAAHRDVVDRAGRTPVPPDVVVVPVVSDGCRNRRLHDRRLVMSQVQPAIAVRDEHVGLAQTVRRTR